MSRGTLIRLISAYMDRLYQDEYGIKPHGLVEYHVRGESVWHMDLPTLKATFVRLYS